MKVVLKLFGAFFALSMVLAACGGGGSGEGGNSSITVVSDNFEYATASPWIPSSGWTEMQSGSWNIITGGATGNALQYQRAGVSLLANSYSGTNYTISTQLLPVNMVWIWQSCLVGRLQDKDHWYALCVRNGANVELEIDMYNGPYSTLNSTTVSATPLDTSTWYTLTMNFNGTTITGTLTGGGVNATITATNSAFASGRPGLLAWNGDPTYDVRFDNFKVTVP